MGWRMWGNNSSSFIVLTSISGSLGIVNGFLEQEAEVLWGSAFANLCKFEGREKTGSNLEPTSPGASLMVSIGPAILYVMDCWGMK